MPEHIESVKEFIENIVKTQTEFLLHEISKEEYISFNELKKKYMN